MGRLGTTMIITLTIWMLDVTLDPMLAWALRMELRGHVWAYMAHSAY